jgi:molybdopterin/thiamine biosynthesis adenylyltransferase
MELKEVYLRQLDIISPSEIPPITIIGVGGLGSFIVFMLAKMGSQKLIVYDPDTIEKHNLPTQMYPKYSLGSKKVESLKRIIEDFTFAELQINPEKFDENSKLPSSQIVISAVDSMEERKRIWKKIKNENVKFYIDTRMGGEVGEVLIVKPHDPDGITEYEKTLYDDKEALPLPCTAQSIIYNIWITAGVVGAVIKKIVKKEKKIPKRIIIDSKNLIIT